VLTRCVVREKPTAQHLNRQELTAMNRHFQPTAFVVALTLMSGTAALSSAFAAADDAPPPATAPGNEGAGRHHDPAWAACKKQADDQKLQPGDARRDFMKNCIKSAHASAPAAS
jgi:Spy/CpxP family protein refolding chaperone